VKPFTFILAPLGLAVLILAFAVLTPSSAQPNIGIGLAFKSDALAHITLDVEQRAAAHGFQTVPTKPGRDPDFEAIFEAERRMESQRLPLLIVFLRDRDELIVIVGCGAGKKYKLKPEEISEIQNIVTEFARNPSFLRVKLQHGVELPAGLAAK